MDALSYVFKDLADGEERDPNEGTAPIEMSPEELMMSNDVEELSDEMKLEQQ